MPYSKWREFLSCFSRMLNVVVFNGTADLSLSARAHRDRMKNLEAWIDWAFETLTGEKKLCRYWWIAAFDRCQTNVLIHQTRETRAPNKEYSG